MAAYLLRRLLATIPVMGVVALFVFALLHLSPAISGDLLSAVISIRYILGFRKDNPNVFNMLAQNLPHY